MESSRLLTFVLLFCLWQLSVVLGETCQIEDSLSGIIDENENEYHGYTKCYKILVKKGNYARLVLKLNIKLYTLEKSQMFQLRKADTSSNAIGVTSNILELVGKNGAKS
ncbi:hypothetical protein CEXT_383461 [Caerostris extrusa]|uniref:Uncharacterized protein n=1 Tax=Caerostris extrusa TaxID=172846 RepID=A0AAV4XI89_CAEEX|nr:hypothetical protein CEXT_383461 [Caerostris extrusa]